MHLADFPEARAQGGLESATDQLPARPLQAGDATALSRVVEAKAAANDELAILDVDGGHLSPRLVAERDRRPRRAVPCLNADVERASQIDVSTDRAHGRCIRWCAAESGPRLAVVLRKVRDRSTLLGRLERRERAHDVERAAGVDVQVRDLAIERHNLRPRRLIPMEELRRVVVLIRVQSRDAAEELARRCRGELIEARGEALSDALPLLPVPESNVRRDDRSHLLEGSSDDELIPCDPCGSMDDRMFAPCDAAKPEASVPPGSCRRCCSGVVGDAGIRWGRTRATFVGITRTCSQKQPG